MTATVSVMDQPPVEVPQTQVPEPVVVDPAPLWSPVEERVFRVAARRSPPDDVGGVGLAGMFRMVALRSPLVAATRAAHVVALIAFVLYLHGLSEESSWGVIWANSWRQLWTVVLLLVVTYPVRRMGAIKLFRYLSLGMMLAPAIVYYVSGPLIDAVGSDNPDIWVVPAVEEAVKIIPVVVLLAVLSRLRYRYGVADILVIGYVLGVGFSFTENALYDRVLGFDSDGWVGYVLPSALVRFDGFVVAGHGVWTAMAAAGLALVVIHHRSALWTVVGAVVALLPVVAHMQANDPDWDVPWLHHVLIGDHSEPLFFVAVIIIAVVLDVRTLRSVAAADHLLAAPGRHILRSWRRSDSKAGAPLASLRYLRLRNGIHFRRASQTDPWPQARTTRDFQALQTLGRTGRRAGIVDATLPAGRGWADDPVGPGRQRWFTEAGWTPYLVAADGASAWTEAAPGRPDARPQPPRVAGPDRMRNIAIFVAAVAIYVVFRIVAGTTPDESISQFAPAHPAPGDPAPPGAGNGPLPGASLPSSGGTPPPSGLLGGPASGPPAPPPPDPPPDPEGPPDDDPEDDCE